jgi:DNA-binding NtrC family response regulator
MLNNAKILILDDEPDMAENLGLILNGAGYETIVETESPKALNLVERDQPDLIVTDLVMPNMDGMDILEQIKDRHPELPVIVLTGYATVDSAVTAVKRGATDYLSKPFSPEEILLRVQKALSWKQLREENRYLRDRVQRGDQYGEIVGQSQALEDVLKLVDKVAATTATVLLSGESGTGKDLFARTIHQRSSRQDAPFFAVNCGALTETLLDSELFGHERGAFTGASATKKGIFEVANKGTLFLDEISETSLAFQTKLLRVTEEGEFLRVGGTQPIKADVRLISSSNQDMRKAVDEGHFRKDLFYRLGVFQIHIPPLRERVEDLPPLIAYFLNIYSRQIKKKVSGVSAAAMEVLTHYYWPGNIRELENVIERAVIIVEGGEILPEDLPGDLLKVRCKQPKPVEEMQNLERELIVRTLRECNWNRSLAAKRLGMGRRTLYDKLARLGISLQPAS